jgi:hypothetical protein
MAILRVDYQVDDTQGRALSGALVYICTQPATIANPPSPLASVFTSIAGNVAAANPLVTDQYGHCAPYLSNNQLYTFVVIHPLVGMLVYPDQNAGASGNTGGLTGVIPAGTINGTNQVFTLSQTPVMVIKNGQIMIPGLGCTIAGGTIVFATAPQIGDSVYAFITST